MAVYYLAAYVGSGTDDDPHRPSGADLDGKWSSIDFRPPGATEGRAILVVPEALPSSPQRLKLGDDLDGLTVTVRRSIENRLGVDLSAASSIREVLADLLIRHGNNARKDRWNQPKAEWDGFHRIHLGGLVYEVPALKALSISDNFNRTNNTDINVGAPFTWGGTGVSEMQISSNTLRNQTTNALVKSLRAETDLASANHYAQLTLFLSVTTSLSAGPRVRCANDLTAYESTVQQNSTNYRIAKTDGGGTVTVLSTKTTAVTPTSGKTLRLDANGSTLTSTLDGGTDSITITDTSITGNLRVGIKSSGSTSGLRAGGDDFTAGDLTGGSTVNATLAASLGSLTATVTATPTVNATLASSLGGLSAAAAATPTVNATLSAPLGRAVATATATPTVAATLAAPLGPLTATASATPTVAASLNAPLGGVTGSATAVPTEPAVLTAPLGALAASLTATVTPGSSTVDATLDAPLGSLTAQADAKATEPAVLNAPLGALTAGATATPNVQATLHAGLGALAAAAAAVVSHPATGTAPLGGLHATATAVVVKTAVLQALLGGLNAHATATAHAPGVERDVLWIAGEPVAAWTADPAFNAWLAGEPEPAWHADPAMR